MKGKIMEIKIEQPQLNHEKAKLNLEQIFEEYFPNDEVKKEKFRSDVEKILEAAGKSVKSLTQEESDNFSKYLYETFHEFEKAREQKKEEIKKTE